MMFFLILYLNIAFYRMKKKILYLAIGSIISTSSIAYANDSIQYQQMNQVGNVNAAPSTPPAGMEAAYSNEYQNQQAATNTNGTSITNERGETVYRTEETRKIQQNGNPNQRPSSSLAAQSATEKFWNMSNSQIRNIRKKYEQRSAAIGQDINPAQCVQNTINVSNEPGATIPVIRLDGRNVATVLMTDVFGKPWTVDTIVNSDNISVVVDSENPEASSFSIQTKNNNGQGNFVVKLKDHHIPIVFSYVNNQSKVDCLTIAKLDKAGPNSDVKTENLTMSAMDGSLNSTLYGVAPKGSKQLKVSNSAATAWRLDSGEVVIRTKYQLLAPRHNAVTRSPDGTYVYKVQYSPVYTYRYNDLIGEFTIGK